MGFLYAGYEYAGSYMQVPICRFLYAGYEQEGWWNPKFKSLN